MSLSVNPSAKFAVEELTKLNFGEDENSLQFRFIKAYEATVPEIVNSMTPTIWTRVASPDVIRFSRNSTLVEKIQQLAKGIQLYKIPRSYDEESGYYEIPAKDSLIFFEAIRQLQAKGSDICIPTKRFQNALRSVQENHYLTSKEAEIFKEKIKTSLTLKEYESDAEKTRDVNKALSMAYYHRNTERTFSSNSAMYWLCEANGYLGDKSVGKVINLDEFFQKFKRIDSLAVFRSDAEVIADAAAKCSSIKKLYFSPFTSYYLETVKRIGSFLTKTTSIEEVVLASVWTACEYKRLSSETVVPIAEALSTNTSITKLDVCVTEIQDEGVLKILEAIESNPHSKIRALNFASCGITDVGAKKIIEVLRKREQITWINTYSNEAISKSVSNEIEEILQVNLAKNTRKIMLELSYHNYIINVVLGYLDLPNTFET